MSENNNLDIDDDEKGVEEDDEEEEVKMRDDEEIDDDETLDSFCSGKWYKFIFIWFGKNVPKKHIDYLKH